MHLDYHISLSYHRFHKNFLRSSILVYFQLENEVCKADPDKGHNESPKTKRVYNMQLAELTIIGLSGPFLPLGLFG